MSLFSSSSKSTSSVYNESHQTSNTLGDLSHDNLLAGGNLEIYQEGLSHDNLDLILSSNDNTTQSAIKSAQILAGQAIETTGKAYADAYSGATNDASRFLDGLKPFAVIAGIVFVIYLWGKK